MASKKTPKPTRAQQRAVKKLRADDPQTEVLGFLDDGKTLLVAMRDRSYRSLTSKGELAAGP